MDNDVNKEIERLRAKINIANVFNLTLLIILIFGIFTVTSEIGTAQRTQQDVSIIGEGFNFFYNNISVILVWALRIFIAVLLFPLVQRIKNIRSNDVLYRKNISAIFKALYAQTDIWNSGFSKKEIERFRLFDINDADECCCDSAVKLPVNGKRYLFYDYVQIEYPKGYSYGWSKRIIKYSGLLIPLKDIFSQPVDCRLEIHSKAINSDLLKKDIFSQLQRNIIDKVKNKKLKEVITENVEFNRLYTAYSDDQIKSRMIMTLPFLEKLADASKKYSFNFEIAFDGRDVYVFIQNANLIPNVKTLFGSFFINIWKFDKLFANIEKYKQNPLIACDILNDILSQR